MRRVLVIAGLVGVLCPPCALAASRIYYASDWSGSMEIYAVDPARRSSTAQITFGLPARCAELLYACGFVDPLPAPNGRFLLYRGTDGTLWLAHADGRAARSLPADAHRPDWSRDSRQVAYSANDGIHVVRADGGGDRLAAAGLVGQPIWTPDGRSLHVSANSGFYSVRGGEVLRLGNSFGELVSSPDKRWAATVGGAEEGKAIDLTSLRIVHLGDAVAAAAWSGDSVHLGAITHGNGMVVYDVRRVSSRVVTYDTGYRYGPDFGYSFGLAYSPDGRSLAYVPGGMGSFGGGIQSGDLRTVSLSGRIKTVVSTERAFGGRMIALAWARAGKRLRYRAPEEHSRSRATASSVLAVGPVHALATDGEHVVFAACEGAYAWTPSTADLTTAEQIGAPSSCMEHINYAIYGVAVAGNRFLYADSSGCNIISQRVVLKLLGQSDRPTTIAHGNGNCGAPYHPFVDDLRSDADLLVFGSALERGGGDGRHFVTTQQSVQRVGAAGCPCPAIASSPGPLIPADVDGGRILAYGDLATLVLDRGGRVLESLPVAPAAAQLAGDEVVVLVRGQLRDYDAHDGTLFHSWPLPDVPSGRGCWLRCFEDKLVLQDAARGLAAYSLDGEVHLLRLADGVDKVFARAAVARFMNGGLVYAQGSRIRIVPPAQLPLRGF